MTDWQRLIPGYWHQQSPTCYEYSEALSRAIDKHGVKLDTKYAAYVGDVRVWISGWPYNYGHSYQDNLPEVLPTIAVRKKLRAAVCAATASVFTKDQPHD